MPRARRQANLLRWGASAAVGGFVFGFQAAVISGALLSIRREFRLTALEQGALVSALPLGAMIGSLLAGRLADERGRRRALMIHAGVVLIGTAVSVGAPDYGALVAGRAIVGLGVGAISSNVPLYLAEIAPFGVRGRLVTLNQLLVAVGILAAYGVDLAFAAFGSWRAMFAAGLAPVVLLLLAMLPAPETPAWLEAHARGEDARRVLLDVVDEHEADVLLDSFRRSRRLEGRRMRVTELLRSNARPALVLGVALAVLQQFSGINAIVYYAPSILAGTGLSASAAILSSLIVAAVNLAATAISLRLVDRVGRRPLLLGSLVGVFVSLVLLGLSLVLRLGGAGRWLALVCILAYVAAFAVGLGPIVWLLVTEIFPTDARAAGGGLSTAANWFSNFLVGLVFPPLVTALGAGPTFWIFGAACALGLTFVTRYVPETAGRSFAEIEADLHKRWPAAA